MDFLFSLEGMAETLQSANTIKQGPGDIKFARKMDKWRTVSPSPVDALNKRVLAIKTNISKMQVLALKIPGPPKLDYVAYGQAVTVQAVDPTVMTNAISAGNRIATAVLAAGGRPGSASKIVNVLRDAQQAIPVAGDKGSKSYTLAFPTSPMQWPSAKWFNNSKGITEGHVAIINQALAKLESIVRQVALIIRAPNSNSMAEMCDRVAFVNAAFVIVKLSYDFTTQYIKNLRELAKVQVSKK